MPDAAPTDPSSTSTWDVTPASVEDLDAWEPAALETWFGLACENMMWAINRTMPTLEHITRAHRALARETSEGTRSPHDPLPAGFVANILLLRGYTRLDDLWHLGKMYRRIGPRSQYHRIEFIAERHRRGYTVRLFDLIESKYLQIEFPDRWHEVFPTSDLLLALEAGLGGPELRDILKAGVYPDRDSLSMLAGLRRDTAG